MNEKLEKEFAEMVANLLQTEFCPDWDPKLLHGFMGIASEAGELLERYSESLDYQGVPFTRTDTLIEVSDLLHYMQMMIGVLDSTLTEIVSITTAKYRRLTPDSYFYDGVRLNQCERLDPVLLRGFVGVSSTAGELLNRYKKFIFYHGEPFTRTEILDGLAKLFYYMLMIISKHDSSVEEVMRINMAKLDSRYPNGYSHDKAITHQRDKKAERAAVEAVVEKFAQGHKKEMGG